MLNISITKPKGLSGNLKTVMAFCIGLPLLPGALLCYFAWPPDLAGRNITIAAAENKSGDRFALMQQWDSDNFYSTFLVWNAQDGTYYYPLTKNDTKQWRCQLEIHEETDQVIARISRQRHFMLNLETKLINRLP